VKGRALEMNVERVTNIVVMKEVILPWYCRLCLRVVLVIGGSVVVQYCGSLVSFVGKHRNVLEQFTSKQTNPESCGSYSKRVEL